MNGDQMMRCDQSIIKSKTNTTKNEPKQNRTGQDGAKQAKLEQNKTEQRRRNKYQSGCKKEKKK